MTFEAETWPTSLSRADVVNRILTLFEEPKYLEIGVSTGDTFLAVKAHRKVAVDPVFGFDVAAAARNDSNARFHAMESDNYFGDIVADSERFDVIFLDGLHTVEQTLRDFCNAIEFLEKDGVIVVDDVAPDSYAASLPDLMETVNLRAALGISDLNWMGDVYRLVFFISAFFQQYQFATVAENHGQLVVWKKRREGRTLGRRTLEEIGRLPYARSVLERDVYNILPFREIMALLRNCKN